MEAPPFIIKFMGYFSSSAIMLLYLIILSTGAQSITVDRDARRSDGPDEYEGIKQQYIIKY